MIPKSFDCAKSTLYSDIRSKSDSNSDVKINEDELSTIFYSDVAKFKDLQSIKDKVEAKDEQSHLDDLINQVYIMASVTEKKFDDYQKIQAFALEQKKQKAMEDWSAKFKKNVYIRVEPTYTDCKEMNRWKTDN